MTIKAAMEQQAGAEPLEALQGERMDIAERIAPLHARYGAFGTFPERRDNLYAAIALEMRARLEIEKKKATEQAIDELVRSDPRYLALFDEADMARAELYLLEVKLKNLDERFTRDTQACRFASETARLGVTA